MKRISYYLVYGFAYAISLLPFWMLYFLSDMIWVVVYYIARYRRALVKKNLSSSFPEKDEKELKDLEKQFYHWLCDYGVESVKLLSISKKSLFKRLKFSGVDQLEQMFDEGRNCAIMTGHYCNWEWYTGIMKYMTRHHQVAAPVIYHPLYNEAFDRLFIDIRSANGCVCVAKNDILRSMFNYKKEGRQTMFGYVSDQSPKWENMHLWLDFLNHDTPVFTGGERIMRKMNDAVFFLDIERPRRGYYNMSFKLITKEAAKEEEFAITRKYYELLEANIRRQPPFYLWTHNRWKRGREEFNLKYDIINGRIVRKEEFK